MQAGQILTFGPYRFDVGQGQLWRGTQEVKLTPKTLVVLRHMVEHAGQVVAKEELFQAGWSGTVVSDAALAVCVQELRRALRDNAHRPRYLETVHRRGYRFIGTVVSSHSLSPTLNPQHPVPLLVGREAELSQLQGWLEKALAGKRQLAFLSGEPGIGKTTLAAAFLAHVAAEATAWIGRGQCIEHYGAGEAYLPLLDALGRLCRGPDGQRMRALLEQYAPTWLVQMPALLSTAALEALQRKTAGATKERMLRELAEAVELITAERPLALVLEDLHWGDHSTLDWLAFMARRQERARLLVLGTYRPVEMLANGHPLRTVKQELQLHRQCVEQRLGLLSQEHVATYLAVKFSPGGDARRAVSLHQLAHVIHQRTEGNPLFMVNVVEYLAAQGGRGEAVETVQRGVPGDLRHMIEEQLHRLSVKEQQLLEVASVVGMEFSAASVAAGAEIEVEAIEEQCTQLARREFFLRPSGTTDWPDGTVAARYSFLHALYQEVLYERLPAGRRQRLHQRIGEREEKGYGERAREIAAELAMHFERSRDYRKAVQYLQHAGENALQRSAHQEANSLLTKGLALLMTLPDTPERAGQELTLQVSLGAVLTATKGFAAPEVELVYARARELCRQVGDTAEFFRVLQGVWGVYYMRGDLQMARELGEQLVTLAQRIQEPSHLLLAHSILGDTLLHLGEVASALAHMEQGLACDDPRRSSAVDSINLLAPGVYSLSVAALASWGRGYPDQAVERIQQALAVARELSQPFGLATALACAAQLHCFRREWLRAQAEAEEVIAHATEQGFAMRAAHGTMARGLALVGQGKVEEGVAQMRQGRAAYRATGGGMGATYSQALLAEAYGKVGRVEEGLAVLAKALAVVDKTGERFYEAELYRIKGELTLQSSVQRLGSRVKTGPQSRVHSPKSSKATSQILNPQSHAEVEAEECFRKAIEIAQKQQAKSWELRATMSLALLWQQQGKKVEAHEMLSEIYNWFTEGFDTKDLQEAKALLAELA